MFEPEYHWTFSESTVYVICILFSVSYNTSSYQLLKNKWLIWLGPLDYKFDLCPAQIRQKAVSGQLNVIHKRFVWKSGGYLFFHFEAAI